MIFLTVLMVGLMGYQVTMPQVDNAKFSYTVHEGKIIRFNTQDGSMEKCEISDETYKCKGLTKE